MTNEEKILREVCGIPFDVKINDKAIVTYKQAIEALNVASKNFIKPDVIKSGFGKWTAIEEEKPPYGMGVLIVMGNGFITTAYRKKSAPFETTWYVYHDNLALEDVVITHWMPLSNLPKTVL